MGDAPAPTASQLVAKAFGEKAVSPPRSPRQMVMNAVAKFYVFIHLQPLRVVQTRLEDIMLGRNPSDPYKDRPHIGQQLPEEIRKG